ncbi:MAG TPA: hypothetical protein VNJ01_14905 [Bacteriovoracaceae bacterium]|nr:hypothetical protein [Bacteriovoracaceae bacterium]
MKITTLLFITLSSTAQAQIFSYQVDLHDQYEKDVAGKSPQQVKKDNMAYYQKFLTVDVNSKQLNQTYASDLGKPKYLSQKNAVETWVAAISNPIIGTGNDRKYDPTYGIGFCFGRALFVDLYLTLNGFNQGSIKKIFVVGPMTNDWSWHVATMVQGLDENKKEKWLVLDPIIFKVVEVVEWFKDFEAISADGKIRMYITEANKFSIAPLKYQQENYQGYNGYFEDMFRWMDENQVQGKLVLDKI